MSMLRSFVPVWLRRRLAPAARAILYRGDAVRCPYCDRGFRRFLPGGEDAAILHEADVVGARPREQVHCPSCFCMDRERLVFLWLRDEARALEGRPLRVLHAAPEPRLAERLRDAHAGRYVSIDIADPRADVRADLTGLPFRDAAFDLLVCNHVLEHVPDDRRAMREIRRVLAPGGMAVLQVPIAHLLHTTVEDPAERSPDIRLRRFGRHDHVRIYTAADYRARLESAGLEVEVWRFAERHGADAARKYGVDPREDLFVARSPAGA